MFMFSTRCRRFMKVFSCCDCVCIMWHSFKWECQRSCMETVAILRFRDWVFLKADCLVGCRLWKCVKGQTANCMYHGQGHYGPLESYLPISQWFESVRGHIFVGLIRMGIVHWIGFVYSTQNFLQVCHEVDLNLFMS